MTQQLLTDCTCWVLRRFLMTQHHMSISGMSYNQINGVQVHTLHTLSDFGPQGPSGVLVLQEGAQRVVHTRQVQILRRLAVPLHLGLLSPYRPPGAALQACEDHMCQVLLEPLEVLSGNKWPIMMTLSVPFICALRKPKVPSAFLRGGWSWEVVVLTRFTRQPVGRLCSFTLQGHT